MLLGAGVTPHASIAETQEDHDRDRHAPGDDSCSWDVDHAGGVATLQPPEALEFTVEHCEDVLAWTLVWLMAPLR